jgi:hypothetical protein
LLWSFIGRRFVVANAASYTERRTYTRRRDPARDERVVDLDEEDFHREPKPGSPWSDRRLGED